MNENRSLQIDAEAAKALAEWKGHFAELVTSKAKEIALASGPEAVLTLNHYRQAAKIAAQELAKIVSNTDSSDGNQKAA